MSSGWEWNGARWWKFDLHAHTPKSECYGQGPDQAALKARSAQDWLLDHMRARIDCVAVTDHDSGEWVDELKAAERNLVGHPEYRQLCLFPGVELFVNSGFHVLLILDPTKTGHDVSMLVGACGLDPRSKVTTKSFVEIFNEASARDGLVIPAHVDEISKKGLWSLGDEKTWQQLLDIKGWTAWEVVDPSKNSPDVVLRSHRSFTSIVGSDSHQPSQVGTKYCWVKMTKPSIGGLRLALMDGENSAILRSDKHPNDPNEEVPAWAVESLSVEKTQFIGRSEGAGAHPFVVKFNPWMNSIIGGRGTGKSSLLEFLRIALRRDKELLEGDNEELKDIFQRYNSKGGDNLLLDGATFRVEYRKKGGARYMVNWNIDGAATAIEEEISQDVWQSSEGEVTSRFPIRIYSQKQLFGLASNPSALLGIVDDAPEVDRRAWEQRRKELETAYFALRADIARLKTGLDDEIRVKGSLADVRRQLELYETKENRDVLKSYQRLRLQQRAIEQWTEQLSLQCSRLEEFAPTLGIGAVDASLFDVTVEAEKRLLDRVQRTTEDWKRVAEPVEATVETAKRFALEWGHWLSKSLWKEQSAQIEQRYNGLVETLKAEGIEDPAEYGRRVQEKQVLEERLKEFEQYRSQIAMLEGKSKTNLDEIVSHRSKLTEKRQRFLATILSDNQLVRMFVVPYGNHQSAKKDFKELLGRTDDRYDERILCKDGDEGVLARLYCPEGHLYVQTWMERDPTEKNKVASEFEQRLSNLKKEVIECRKGTAPAGLKVDGHFENWLVKQCQSDDFVNRLAVWFPEDEVRITYASGADGGRFRNIEQASPGQKTAAILSFVLSYGDDPLVLDQPEDDLDNQLIYDLVVKQLQACKKRRQVIVVTHNANIVVNGDSELVIALESRAGRTEFKVQGGLQEPAVRDEICKIMEGGKEAFEKRYQRILGGA